MLQAILLICAIFCFALDAMALPMRVRILSIGLIFLCLFFLLGTPITQIR